MRIERWNGRVWFVWRRSSLQSPRLVVIATEPMTVQASCGPRRTWYCLRCLLMVGVDVWGWQRTVKRCLSQLFKIQPDSVISSCCWTLKRWALSGLGPVLLAGVGEGRIRRASSDTGWDVGWYRLKMSDRNVRAYTPLHFCVSLHFSIITSF